MNGLIGTSCCQKTYHIIFLIRKCNFNFDSFSFRSTKDRTLHSPFPTFSQIHITASKSALDANIRILLGYKSSGDNIAPVLFSQPISNIQGLAKAVEERKEATLVKRKMKNPR